MKSWLGRKKQIPENAGPKAPADGDPQGYAAPGGLDELMAAVKGRAATAAVKKNAAELFPLSAAIIATRKKALAEAFRNASPGQMIKGQGIFLGTYTPNSCDSGGLRLTFNVVAAPEDLTDEVSGEENLTYFETGRNLSLLKNWHGYAGSSYADDAELHQALKNGTYKGEWVIPTRELLYGKDVRGYETQAGNLFALKDTGSFKGTFTANNLSSCWYWSCTKTYSTSECIYNMDFHDGKDGGFDNPSVKRARCRPVRLVLAEEGP